MMVYIMATFKSLPYKHSRKHCKNKCLQKCNQYLNKIYEYAKAIETGEKPYPTKSIQVTENKYQHYKTGNNHMPCHHILQTNV